MKGIRKKFNRLADFLVTNDFIAKVLCLLLAVILWSNLDIRNQVERKYKIRAEYRNLPHEYAVSENQQKDITVILRGNKDDLVSISRQNISVFIDMQNPVVGKIYKYPVDVVTRDIPDTVKVDIVEDSVLLTVENMDSRFVDVKPELKGDLADGFLLGNITIQPDQIKISGAESDIRKINEVMTNTVYIQGWTETTSKTYNLNTEDKELEYSTNSVKLTIEVIPSDGVERVHVPLVIQNLDEGFSGTISETSVDVFIRPSEGVSVEDLTVLSYLDLSSINIQSFKDSEGKKRHSIKRKIPVRSVIGGEGKGKILTVVPNRVEVEITRGDN